VELAVWRRRSRPRDA